MEKLKKMLSRAAGGTIAITGSDSALLSTLSYLIVREDPLWSKRRETEDLLVINSTGGNIGIDEIAQTGSFILHKPDSGRKYIIVNDVERLTKEAANSFLKVLEEPPDFITIILTSSSWNAVLTTIRSRAMEIRINYPIELLKELKLLYREGTKHIYAGCQENFVLLKYCLDNDVTDLIAELKELEEYDLPTLVENITDSTQENEADILKRRKVYTLILQKMIDRGWKGYYDSFFRLSSAFENTSYFDRNREFAAVIRSILRDFLIVFTTYNWNLVANIDLIEWLSEFNCPDFNMKDYKWCDGVVGLKRAGLNNNLLLNRLLFIFAKSFLEAGKTEGKYA